MHGHSFYVQVVLAGEQDEKTGWVRDLDEVNLVLQGIREKLDHCLLNEIDGLDPPTLENLARHIFHSARSKLPEVCRVKLSRPSYGQSCVYEE